MTEGQRMPDSPEVRLSVLEREVVGMGRDIAAVRQRADDHEKRISEFIGLAVEQARDKEKLEGIQKGLDALRSDVRDLRDDYEQDNKERDRIRREREDKEKDRDISDRRARLVQWLMLAALVFSAIASTVAVITVSGGAAG